MAKPSRHVRVLVLRKTKLGESDVILTCLNAQGEQVRMVAKGARKPTSTFASRLELFCVSDVLIHEGKNLHIVSEARLVEGFAHLRSSATKVAAASPILEALYKIAQEDLASPILFDMSVKALTLIEQTDDVHALLLCAAAMLKIVMAEGVRPSLDSCISCGRSIDIRALSRSVGFSFDDGGVVCTTCDDALFAEQMEPEILSWVHACMYSTFDALAETACDVDRAFELLAFVERWYARQISLKLTSMQFLRSCGLF